MKKTILKLAALLAVPLLLLVAAQAQSFTFTTSEKIPITRLDPLKVFVPCAGEGGENVELTGTLHVVSHLTINPDLSVHMHVHSNPQGVSGVDSLGRKYQGTGVTQTNMNTDASLPLQVTIVNNFNVVGQGPGNNFMVHANLHITVNADGVITANVDNSFSVECK